MLYIMHTDCGSALVLQSEYITKGAVAMENIRQAQINAKERSGTFDSANLFMKNPISEDEIEELNHLAQEYFIDDNSVFKLMVQTKNCNRNEYEYYTVRLCSRFEITKRYTYNGLEYIDMQFFDSFGESIKCKRISPELLGGRNIDKLKSYGFIFNAYHSKEVENLLNSAYIKTPKTKVQFYPGWYKAENGELSFYGYKANDYDGDVVLKVNTNIDKRYCLSTLGWVPECRNEENNESQCPRMKECIEYIKMMYTNDFMLRKQVAGLNTLINGSVGAQMVISVSLSAALFGYLSVQNVAQFNTPLFHFYGASSQGKTTGLKLAASIWGNPEEKNNLNGSWNKTPTKLIENLCGNNGVPYILNEFGSKGYGMDIQHLVYCIAEGEGKDRMNNVNKSVCTWHTAVLSCGENSIVDALGGNSGLYARVFEFFNLEITLSAKHAENIANFCTETYGALGYAFVAYVKANYSAIKDRFKKLNEIIAETIGELSSISQRVAKYIAVVILSAEVANKLGMKLSPLKIGRKLVDVHKETIEKIPNVVVNLNKILSYVKRNSSRFVNDEYDLYRNRDGFDTETQVIFIDTAFTDVCKKLEIDSRSFLGELKANGYLDCLPDRYYKKRNINGTCCKCYLINKEPILPTEQSRNQRKRKTAGKAMKGGSVLSK